MAVAAYFTMRLVAPVASLQGSRIDTLSDTLPIPTRSMVAGIIGAALGLGYREYDLLQNLQDAIRLGVVAHRAGVVELDFQTVRMGLPHMVGPMWWHDGQRLGAMERTGGDPERGLTGERPLTCDIDMSIIVELHDNRFAPKAILDALNTPAYPLGIGQRCCLPTEPVAVSCWRSRRWTRRCRSLPGGDAELCMHPWSRRASAACTFRCLVGERLAGARIETA